MTLRNPHKPNSVYSTVSNIWLIYQTKQDQKQQITKKSQFEMGIQSNLRAGRTMGFQDN